MGNDQSSCTGRCTTTISSVPLWRRTTSPPAAWMRSVGEGSSAVIDRRATASHTTVAPCANRGNRRRPGSAAPTRSSLTAMSDAEGNEPGGHDPVEIEWQFDALDLRPVERWLAALPTLAVETGDGGTVTALARPPRRLVDSYLDTEDWRIVRAGFVVRTRRRGRQDEVTLKDTRPAEGSGLRQRLEVTEVLPDAGLAALGPYGPVGRRLRAIVGTRKLHEVLQVRTRRRPFALRVGGVDTAEVALDDTIIVVGNGQRPMQLRRVEVEVHPEWLDALEPIVEQLRASCGLQPARLSKFEAGLLALGEEIPGTPDLGPADVSATSTMGELAFAVLRRQLAVLRDKEPGTRLGEDPEELHDMRVATRRLRAALSLFESVLPVRAHVFREELGWLGRLLGAVRDLDVQKQGLVEMAAQGAGARAEGTDHDPLADLAAVLERERQTARAEMLSGLDSVRWDRLVKGLTVMAQQGPARRSLARGSLPRSACPTSSWRATARSRRRPGRPSGPGWSRTSTVCASGASGCATRSSSAPTSTEAAPPASCASSPSSRTSSARCRMPRWRRSSWPLSPPGRPVCPPPRSS